MRMQRLAFAAFLAAGVLAAPSAQADWRGRGHYGHGYGYGYRPGPGVGAIIGLGAGVAIGSALAPRAYYPPPPYSYGGQQVFTPHVPPAPPYPWPPQGGAQGFGPPVRK